jgi:hypothetical protein
MTWGEFRIAVEDAGIDDRTAIDHLRWREGEELVIAQHAGGKRFSIEGGTGEDKTMKAVDLWRNADGSWTARIFDQTFTGTEQECRNWLRYNGEYD